MNRRGGRKAHAQQHKVRKPNAEEREFLPKDCEAEDMDLYDPKLTALVRSSACSIGRARANRCEPPRLHH